MFKTRLDDHLKPFGLTAGETGGEKAEGGRFSRELRHSLSNAVDMGKAAIGAMGGGEDWLIQADLGTQEAERYYRQPEDVERFTDVSSLSDLANWGAGAAGNATSSLLQLGLGGGVGGLAARGATRLLGGVALREAAKVGATAGIVGTSYPQQFGESIQAVRAEHGGALPEGSVPTMALTAVAQTALDTLPVMGVLGKLGLADKARGDILQKTLTSPTRIRQIGRDLGVTALKEGTTEVAQEAMKLGALEWIDSNKDHFGVEQMKQLVDSFAAGGVGGAMMGAPVAGLNALHSDKPWFRQKEAMKAEAIKRFEESGDTEQFAADKEAIRSFTDEQLGAETVQSQAEIVPPAPVPVTPTTPMPEQKLAIQPTVNPMDETPPIQVDVPAVVDPVEVEKPNDSPMGFEQGFKDLAGAISDNFYQQAFDAVSTNQATLSGVKDPVLARAKPYFEAGLINSPNDLRQFESQGYPELPMTKTVIPEVPKLEEAQIAAEKVIPLENPSYEQNTNAQKPLESTEIGQGIPKPRVSDAEILGDLPINNVSPPSFTPTHELPDGTPVIAHPEDKGVWVGQDGSEYESSDTYPIKAPITNAKVRLEQNELGDSQPLVEEIRSIAIDKDNKNSFMQLAMDAFFKRSLDEKKAFSNELLGKSDGVSIDAFRKMLSHYWDGLSPERTARKEKATIYADNLRRQYGVKPKYETVDELMVRAGEAYRDSTLSTASTNNLPTEPVKKQAERAPSDAIGDPVPTGKPSEKKRTLPEVKAQFADNKIFTQSDVDAARARLKKKLSGTLNSGFDPEIMADGLVLGGAYIESGLRGFGEWSRAMIADVGSGVKPYLLFFYEGARHFPGLDTKGMDTAAEAAAQHAALMVGKQDEVKADEQRENQDGGDIRQQSAAEKLGEVDTGRAREVSGMAGYRGEPLRPQSGYAPSDIDSVAVGKPADVVQSDEGGAGLPSGAGVRTARTDVAAGRGAGKDDAVPGRDGTGGKGNTDARTGSGRTAEPGRVAEPKPKKEKKAKVKKPETVSPANLGAGNYHIADPLALVGGGAVSRFDKNVKAIELFNTLRDEGRKATREEQDVLAAYTGWGSFGQELFQGTWERPKPKDGWGERDKWLREHLEKSEWEGLQRSITTAFYTEPPVVQAMWGMLEKAGFTGGRVLEPGMGVGNFFGMMPIGLKNRSQLAGIELDPLTGGIAQQLYPDANIQIMGYQESKTPDGFYDLVIGNVPFENTAIADRRYNRLNPMLHDYFFLKGIDQLRAGGVMMAITSTGTMDKKDAKIRRELAKKAELVAAYRLPAGAFKEYAGTEVVTDILVFRKRAEPITDVSDVPWVSAVEVEVGSSKTKAFINGYFKDYRAHKYILGQMGVKSGRFGAEVYVEPSADTLAELNNHVRWINEKWFDGAERKERFSYIANHTRDREGALTLQGDKLHVVMGEYLVPAEQVNKYALKDAAATAKREDQLRQLIGMRRAYGDLITAERGGVDATAQRTTLKGLYDAFVGEHGRLTDSYGLGYLKKIQEPFFPALAALENGGQPAQILTSSTMRAKPAMENPTVADAFVLARNGSINPTVAEVAALAKLPEDKVKAELVKSGAVFETVEGDIVPTDMYLSGNVREKLRQAQAAVDAGMGHLARNVEALQKVIPKDIPYFNIEVQLGAPWVATQYYAEYIAHMLGRQSAAGIKVTFNAGRWRAELPDHFNRLPEASTGFGTGHYKFSKLLNAALSNQTVAIKVKDEDGNLVIEPEYTKEANARIAKIRGEFQGWLWADAERRVDVEAEYNESRNSYADPVFDGSFLSFEGMALSLGNGPFNLRQHQVNAIWRALVKRKSLNAHEVGTGKTFTMGGIAVESRRYGIAKKPLILAHNANSKSVATEIQMMYPSAKVLYLDNLSPATIETKLRQIANDDWDAVVMPHSLIDRLSFREETLMKMAQEEIAALMEEAEAAAEEDGTAITDDMWDDPEELKKLRSPTAKDLVKTRNRIIESIRKQAQSSSREGAVNFEDLGIDMVMVDEVHEFKKPPLSTRMRMKGLNAGTSERSIALRFMTQYVRDQNNGGNVHTFTGTPITNTLTEVYHQMGYIMREEMDAAGVKEWDGWFGSFAREVDDVELNAAAEYESVVRLAGFINVPELRRMVGQYMDTVFADDMPEMQPRRVNGKLLSDASLTEKEKLHLLNGRTEKANDRPYKQVIVENADLTPAQKVAFQEVQQLAREWRSASGKAKKEWMQAGDPHSPIVYEGMAAKASFDVRLNDGAALAGMEGQEEDHPDSKASRVIKNVMEVYKSHEMATQVIFTQSGISTTATRRVGAVGEKETVTYKTFSTVRDIVERLVQQGIPREQIAIVDGSTSKDKRKEIADKMNRAEIRVVLGSTQSLGVGVNMQRNLRAMHHMDAPWMPGDLEQRNGRGHRQGNQWNTVLEYRYLTDRIDGRRWQVLAVKQRFIHAFLKAKDDVRVIEGDAAADEESDIVSTFAEAAGDPRILIREKLKKKIGKLQEAEQMHTRGVADARRSAKSLREQAARDEVFLDGVKSSKLVEIVQGIVAANAGKGFSMVVAGKTLAKRDDAKAAVDTFVAANVRADGEEHKLGTFGGYPLWVELPKYAFEPVLMLDVAGTVFEGKSIASLEHQLRSYEEGIQKRAAGMQQRLESATRADGVAVEPFRRGEELARAVQAEQDLLADIAANPVPPPSWLRSGAPAETEVMWRGKPFVVTGHRWNEQGWFVLAEDDKGAVVIPYTEAMDAQGMALYQEREFEKPDAVIEKQEKENPMGKAPPGGWTDADRVDNLKFSRSRTRSGLSVAGLREELVARFGAGRVKMLEKAGRLRLVQGVDELPNSNVSSQIEAAFASGKKVVVVGDGVKVPDGGKNRVVLRDSEIGGMAGLVKAGKQVVVVSSKPVAELRSLKEFSKAC